MLLPGDFVADNWLSVKTTKEVKDIRFGAGSFTDPLCGRQGCLLDVAESIFDLVFEPFDIHLPFTGNRTIVIITAYGLLGTRRPLLLICLLFKYGRSVVEVGLEAAFGRLHQVFRIFPELICDMTVHIILKTTLRLISRSLLIIFLYQTPRHSFFHFASLLVFLFWCLFPIRRPLRHYRLMKLTGHLIPTVVVAGAGERFLVV